MPTAATCAYAAYDADFATSEYDELMETFDVFDDIVNNDIDAVFAFDAVTAFIALYMVPLFVPLYVTYDAVLDIFEISAYDAVSAFVAIDIPATWANVA